MREDSNPRYLFSMPVFKTGTLNHSDTHPLIKQLKYVLLPTRQNLRFSRNRLLYFVFFFCFFLIFFLQKKEQEMKFCKRPLFLEKKNTKNISHFLCRKKPGRIHQSNGSPFFYKEKREAII